MRFTECLKRPVLSTASATTLGKVSGFAVDPQRRAVVAVAVKARGDGDVVLWPALKAFGPDAVTVPDDGALTAAEEPVARLLGKDAALLGKRVLTEGGDEAGEVQDVEFDPATGRVLALRTSEGEVDGERLLGVGRYAVVVARPAG